MIEITVYSRRLFSEQFSRFDCNEHMLKGNGSLLLHIIVIILHHYYSYYTTT